MSWALQLVLALAIFAAGGAAGIKYHAGVDAQKALKTVQATDKERVKKVEKGDAAAGGHEADKARIRTEFITITKEVEKIVEKPVYRDTVCFDDDGLRALGSAIGGRATPGQPAPAVP